MSSKINKKSEMIESLFPDLRIVEKEPYVSPCTRAEQRKIKETYPHQFSYKFRGKITGVLIDYKRN